MTKTLVIVGEKNFGPTPSGQRGAMLRAFNKATGQEVGAVYMPAPQTGSPMTYLLNGRQYLNLVAIAHHCHRIDALHISILGYTTSSFQRISNTAATRQGYGCFWLINRPGNVDLYWRGRIRWRRSRSWHRRVNRNLYRFGLRYKQQYPTNDNHDDNDCGYD